MPNSPESRIVFDGVWKKFSRGQRFDSLRDLVPAMTAALFQRRGDGELHGKEFWALRDVSFEVKGGEALGIIGPNGAGKSTALKVLTRLLRPDQGQSIVRGRVGALVEIAAGFHPDLTGRENVFMQGAILGMKRAEILSKFDDIVEFAGVGEFIDTPIKRYSSGMNARLGFSVAAHLDPDVLIIDEVLSVGDLSFQEKCFERLQRFVQSGIAVVLVSHNLSAVSSLCARVLVLRQGSVQILGDAHEAITAYTRLEMGKKAGQDHSEVLLRLTDPNGAPVSDVTAGQRVTAVATGRPAKGGRLFSDLVVRHLESGSVVYRSRSYSLGTPNVAVEANGEVDVEWSFVANLGRGHYAVTVVLINEMRRIVATSAPALLTVAERQSERSIVFLDPSCKMIVTQEEMPVMDGSGVL